MVIRRWAVLMCPMSILEIFVGVAVLVILVVVIQIPPQVIP